MATYDDDEPPLDAAQERLRRKLVRLLFVSSGIMVLGLIAVFSAIVYKLGGFGSAASTGAAGQGEAIEATIDIPAGLRIVSSELDGDRALLRVEDDAGMTELFLVDLRTGEIVGRYALRAP